jgi:hypothetical protein
MIKYLLILIFFFSCSSKKNQVIPISGLKSKSEFLNNIQKSFTKIDIKDFKNITFTNYDLRFSDTYQVKLKKIQNELKIEDYEFFISQINEYEKLEKDKIEIEFGLQKFNYILKSDMEKLGTTYNELWTNFRKKYGKKSLLQFSKPLFSKDLQLAIIEIQVISDSENFRSKDLYAFKKINNNWILLAEL